MSNHMKTEITKDINQHIHSINSWIEEQLWSFCHLGIDKNVCTIAIIHHLIGTNGSLSLSLSEAQCHQIIESYHLSKEWQTFVNTIQNNAQTIEEIEYLETKYRPYFQNDPYFVIPIHLQLHQEKTLISPPSTESISEPGPNQTHPTSKKSKTRSDSCSVM
jgi:hypothetical protein